MLLFKQYEFRTQVQFGCEALLITAYKKHSNSDCDLLQEHKKKMKCLVFAAFVFTLIFSVSAQCDVSAARTCVNNYLNMVS